MRRSLAAFAIASLVSARASATTVADPSTSFALDIPSQPDAIVCVLEPASQGDHVPECDAVVPKGYAYSNVAERIVGRVILRYPSYDVGIFVSVTEKKGIGEVSEESIEYISNDLANQFKRASVPLTSQPGGKVVLAEMFAVNGARGVRYTVEPTFEGGPVRIVSFFFQQQDRTHNVIFMAPRDRATEQQALIDRTLPSVRVPRGELRLFGKPRWRRNLDWHARRFAFLVPVGFVVIGALVIWEIRRKRRSLIP